MKVKISKFENLLYLILIPFLCPRGFFEYIRFYKVFFTSWMYFSILVIFGMFVIEISKGKIQNSNYVWVMLLYFISMLIITLIVQNGIGDGLQKLFAAPALCLFSVMSLEKRPLDYLKAISNIILIDFLLNTTFFNPNLWAQYFNSNSHILFIGHVQIAAQLGVLGLFMSFFLFEIGKKGKAILLIILSFLVMIQSGTSASYVVIILSVALYLLSKRSKMIERRIFNANFIIFMYLVLNIIIWLIALKYTTGEVYGLISFLTSGRNFVWNKVFELLNNHWLFGYGVYGVFIRVFWHQWSSNVDGMNYAHNELLQRLLDGGIVLCVLFVLMLYLYMKNAEKVKSNKYKYWAHGSIIIILAIMIFESVTEYYYFYILLSMVAALSKLYESIQNERIKHGFFMDRTS